MISRYSHAAIEKIWSLQSKYETWWQVERAVLEALVRHQVIPISVSDIDQYSAAVKINVDQVSEIEKTTQHDVLAFVAHVAAQMGPVAKWVHYGLTSSDVIDTALALQLKASAKVLQQEMLGCLLALDQLLDAYGHLWIMGRTHGMNAQPMTLEQKFGLWGIHLSEAFLSAMAAIQNATCAKLSGAVLGNYPILSPDIETQIANDLGLREVRAASQVVGRHLHASLMSQLAILMGVVEKIAVDIRQHHRSGIAEIEEGFAKGQKGSSAMPHKKNPVACENLSGVARLMRGYAGASLENIALWLERDISHSSVERVAFPDAFHLCAYGLRRLAGVFSDLQINENTLTKHIHDTKQRFFSQIANLRLLAEGLDREQAYQLVQAASFESEASDQDFLKIMQKKHPSLDTHDMNLGLWNQHPGRSRHLFQELKDHVTKTKI